MSYSYVDPIRVAVIDDKQKPYDACSIKRDAYDPNKFRYIGKGVIYSIDGVTQLSTIEYFFFKKTF